MATNDFLPFAAGGSANVETQAAYAAETRLLNGLVSGIVPSNLLNKTLRQSSIISAMVAQFIADKSGANSVDDGTIATLEANLILAIYATSDARYAKLAGLATQVFSVADGTATNQAVHFGQVNAVRTANVTPLPAASTAITVSHSLGIVPSFVTLEFVCLTAELGYSIGDVVQCITDWNGSVWSSLTIWKTTTQIGTGQASGDSFVIRNKTTNAGANPTLANWAYRFVLR